MLTRCEEIMGEVCADFEAELKQFSGEQGHVQLLVRYPLTSRFHEAWCPTGGQTNEKCL
jgi:REP element-mobilizing transposase RayT